MESKYKKGDRIIFIDGGLLKQETGDKYGTYSHYEKSDGCHRVRDSSGALWFANEEDIKPYKPLNRRRYKKAPLWYRMEVKR